MKPASLLSLLLDALCSMLFASAPMDSRRRMLKKQNTFPAEARDHLLPRLVRGEIAV